MNPATAATTAITAAAGARRATGWTSKISQGLGPRCMATLGNMNSKSTHGAPRLAHGQSMKNTREGVSRMLSARKSACSSVVPDAAERPRCEPRAGASRANPD